MDIKIIHTLALWAETRENPFPPSMRTNIGLEKNEIYVTRYGKSIPAFCCGECSDEAGRKGHYLAWLAEQSAWLEILRIQIEAVFPSVPKHILVVDDTFGGWRSGYATLALLETLYPNVDTYVYAGHNDLTDNFVTGWLEQFAPALAKDIPGENSNTPSRIRYGSPWQEQLKPLITGTEDIWRFINQESPAVKALADHAPAEIVLPTPAWAKALAYTYALQRLNGEIKDDAVVEPADDNHLWPITKLSLYPEGRLAARAWRHNGVTIDDIAQIYGDRTEKLEAGLKDVSRKYEWQSHGQGRDTIYFPAATLNSWINAYHLPETPEYSKPDIPVHGFAEFLPGEVWAGVYPAPANISVNSELFNHLLSTGISRFINLTNPKDFLRNLSYRKALLQTSQETGRKIKIKFLPLPSRTSPTRQQVGQILEHITVSRTRPVSAFTSTQATTWRDAHH